MLKHFLSDQRDKARALKRGGGQPDASLDALSEEERYRVEPADGFSPDHQFDRRWAQTILEQAAGRLREEYTAAGKGALFEALQNAQAGSVTPSYAELAARLGMTESAVASAIFRLRRRHSELLREEVAKTVVRREDIDEEIRYLIEVLGRSSDSP
jgi:RNA polymerase sigma-70 factor (ECF subfamily)